MMENNPGDRLLSNGALSRAEVLMELGRYQEAIPFILQAISEEPDNSHYHRLLADVYFQLAQFKQSLSSAQQALRLDPDNDYAHARLAWLHMEHNHYSRALERARAAVRIDSDDPFTLQTLAWAEYHCGNYTQALEAADHAIELQPDDASLHRLIADLSYNISHGSKAHAKAEKHYRQALKYDPNDEHIHAHLAYVLAAQSKTHEALEHIFTAVKINPQDEDYREQLFDLVHHDLLGLSLESQQKALSRLDPMIRNFYLMQLKSKGWQEKLRFTSIISLWLLLLILGALFFSWVIGDDINKLLPLTLLVFLVYTLTFLSRLFFLLRQKYKKYLWQKQ